MEGRGSEEREGAKLRTFMGLKFFHATLIFSENRFDQFISFTIATRKSNRYIRRKTLTLW